MDTMSTTTSDKVTSKAIEVNTQEEGIMAIDEDSGLYLLE
jgi:hypothetical protein